MPPIRSGSTSGRLCRYATAAWMSRSPCHPKLLGSPSLSPSPRRSKSRTPYPWRASSFALFCEDARPGNEITAAPFREGMYHPCNRNPSARRERHVLVRSAQVGGRNLRARGMRDDVARGDREHDGERSTNSAAATKISRREYLHQRRSSVRRDLHSVTAPRPISTQAGGDREETGVVVAGRPDRPRVVERPPFRRGRRRTLRRARSPRVPRRGDVGRRNRRRREAPVARGR